MKNEKRTERSGCGSSDRGDDGPFKSIGQIVDPKQIVGRPGIGQSLKNGNVTEEVLADESDCSIRSCGYGRLRVLCVNLPF